MFTRVDSIPDRGADYSARGHRAERVSPLFSLFSLLEYTVYRRQRVCYFLHHLTNLYRVQSSGLSRNPRILCLSRLVQLQDLHLRQGSPASVLELGGTLWGPPSGCIVPLPIKSNQWSHILCLANGLAFSGTGFCNERVDLPHLPVDSSCGWSSLCPLTGSQPYGRHVCYLACRPSRPE